MIDLSLLEPDQAVLDEVVDTRRHLHRHPELGFEEYQTTSLIRERLRGLGLDELECPTETGAVALLAGGRPGRTVMVRADIDGLPIHEESLVDFPSAEDGRMHACGHDAHVAIALGVARVLASRAEELPGSYMFVFQPAEELVSGAKEMIARGIFDLMPLDFAVGLHMMSVLPTGNVVARPGLQLAGADAYEIMVSGPGGHGAIMGRAGNVVAAQAAIIQRLDAIVEGLEHDGVECHTTIGEVHSDGAFNVVPRSVVMRGSLRTFTPEHREEGLTRLRGLLQDVETEFAVKVRSNFPYTTPPLVNDPRITGLVLESASAIVGAGAVAMDRPMTVSDDMSEFLAQVPGCYFFVGSAPPGTDPPPTHHSPTFGIDEAAMQIGVRVLSRAAGSLAALGA